MTNIAEGEASLRQFVDRMPGAVCEFRTGADGRAEISFASVGAEGMFGLPGGTGALGWRAVSELVREDDCPVLESAMRRSVETRGQWACVFRVGTGVAERWVSACANPYSAGDGEVRWCGFLQDVTDMKAQEDELALRRSENRMLSAVVNAEGAVSMTFAEAGRSGFPLSYVNDSFLELTGYCRSEVIGRKCDFLQGAGTDLATVRHLAESMKEGNPASVRILNYKKDGTPFWNRLDLTPLWEGPGKLAGYVGVQKDVTEEVYRDRVEREREKMEALGELAGGVAHEINNLLQPIRTITGVVREELEEREPDLAADLGVVVRNAEMAGEVASDVLSFARGTPTEDACEPETPLPGALREAISLVKGLLPSSVTFETGEVDLCLPKFPVVVRKKELVKVLSNLAKNASDAMDARGEIRLGLAYRRIGEREAERAGVKVGRYAVVSVDDHGCGMDDKARASAFEPFFTTKPVGSGTGLGLSMVYRAVRDWGGGVTVDSAVGAGTTVKVLVPEVVKETSGAVEAG